LPITAALTRVEPVGLSRDAVGGVSSRDDAPRIDYGSLPPATLLRWPNATSTALRSGKLMYTVSIGNDITEYTTRAEAIAAAKEMSAESRQPVFVLDESQRERMAYQYGELESYTYETRAARGGGGRDRDRDRDRDRNRDRDRGNDVDDDDDSDDSDD